MIRAFVQEERRTAPVRGAEPAVHRAEHPAGAHSGPLPAAAGSADRLHVPDRALGGRLSGACAPHHARQLRHVQHLHGHAGLAHDRAGLGGEPDAARHRILGRINQILAGDGRPSPRRRIRSHSRAVRGEIEFRGVVGGLPRGLRARRRRPAHPGRSDGRRRGPHRLGQKHAGEPDSAADRPDARARAAGRHRSARAGSRPNCGGRSASCRRRRSCSARPSPRTSPSAWKARPTEQIRRAAELAGLAADIEGFPEGYETMVGERGITLSGGQKQRPPSPARCCAIRES